MDIKQIIVDFSKWDCEVRYGTSVGYEDGISKKADDYLSQQLLQQTPCTAKLPPMHECPICKQKSGKTYIADRLPTVCQSCDHIWMRG